MAEINHDAATPVYRQLAAILRARIEDGTYAPGTRIPSETQLEATYGLARGTVRKVITLLRDEGLIETTMGKGSYVREAPKTGA